jgi:hypothetical protein
MLHEGGRDAQARHVVCVERREGKLPWDCEELRCSGEQHSRKRWPTRNHEKAPGAFEAKAELRKPRREVLWT